MPPMLMQHDEDPAQVIFKAIGMKKPGALPGFELFANRVLLGVYTRPEKTARGVHLPNQTRDEDKYQGKAGLVLMVGPAAFKSDKNYDFMGQKIEVGDWVSLWVSDGKSIQINGQSCRLVRDQDIVMKIPAPDQVY